MSGGIIIQRAEVLLHAAKHPSFFNSMTPAEKGSVNSIDAKGPGGWDQGDIECLTEILDHVGKRR